MDTLGPHAVIAVFIVYVIQWLKSKPWFPLVGYDTEKLNSIVTTVVAFLAGVGIFVTFDKVAGVLTISGLTPANLYHALSHFAAQWAAQKIMYRNLIAPKPAGVVQAMVRQGEITPPKTT